MKALFPLIAITLTILVISGCVAGPNEMVNTPDEGGQIAGFWQGLWQGFISPFTFLISLFSETVHVYDVHNNGNWYNFGFLLGASIIFGGGGGGAARRRR
jgi:branched-subunit amino acid permease